MADQTVQITNMPDSGSPARVAYDLWRMIGNHSRGDLTTADFAKRQLDLYAECFKATRAYDHDTSKLT